jgi:diguanylate cyclase (GGDEF)-like protein/PAS domain S-box-containing protein
VSALPRPSFIAPGAETSANAFEWTLRVLALMLAYAVAGRVGLALPYLGHYVTLLWIPSGIALAAMLRWGISLAPAIAIAAFSTALWVGATFPLAIALALANTAGPLVAAHWLARHKFRPALDRRRDLLLYGAFGAGAGSVVSAALIAACLAVAGSVDLNELPLAFGLLWLGQAIGTLIAGVPLMTLRLSHWTIGLAGRRGVITALLSLGTVASGWASFALEPRAAVTPLIFVPHLLLGWLALRRGLHTASLNALLLTAGAALGTSRGLGPFYAGNAQHALLMLCGYVATVTVLPVLVTVLVAELRANDERWQLALEGTDTGVTDWDLRSNRVVYSTRWKQMLGFSGNEFDDTPQAWLMRVHPEDRVRVQRAIDEHLAGHVERARAEHRLRCRDGNWKWFELTARVVERDVLAQPSRLIATVTDITERRNAEELQRLSSHLVEHLHEGLLITDAQGRILHANPAYVRMSGYSVDELLGSAPPMLSPVCDESSRNAAARSAAWEALQAHGFWRGEVTAHRRNGEIYPQQLTISAVRNVEGLVEHMVLVVADVTQAREHREQLEHQAHHDALTQLPNRLRLATLLRESMASADRDRYGLAVAYLDLDHFKPLNDQFGHDAGDRLLIELAHRLRSALRGGDVVARLGGDEFVLLMRTASREECAQALQRVLQVVAQPYSVGLPTPWSVTASIGAALYPSDHSDADTLLRHADHAMYSAKQAGRNCVQFFDSEHDRQARLRRKAREEAEAALAAGEFCLHYQPKVDLQRGVVLGVEALLRWNHPHHGLLPPAEFLPLIEPDDFAATLGDWVLRSSIAQLAQWCRQGLDLTVSVNISGRHLQQARFAERLAELLEDHDPRIARRLELEVLETTALADVELTSEVMERCRALGVRFALDDFGTGYSPLTYLKRLPVDVLKIDRSFVHSMLSDPEDLAIVEGVIGLSRTFGCEVVAEGVETEEHARCLADAGCEVGQGFGIARPMPASEVAEWVRGYGRECVAMPV